MEDIKELYENAVALLQSEKYKEAIEVLKLCKQENPFEPAFNLRLGFAYQKCNDVKSALSEYLNAIENAYEGHEPFLQIGRINYQRSNYREALDYFDKALKISTDNSEIFFSKGWCYQKLGFFERASNEFSKAIEINNDNHDYYYCRANTFFIQEDFVSAEKDFTEAIMINSLHTQSYFGRAEIYLKTNRIDLAINDYSYILKIDSNNIKALYQRGITNAKIENYHSAIADFKEIVKISPDETNSFSNIGVCYMNLEDFDSAIGNFNIVIGKQPENIEALTRRGMLFFLKREYIKGKIDLLKAVSLAEKISYNLKQIDSVYYTIALIEIEKKEVLSAIEYLKKCKLNNFLVYAGNKVYELDNDIKVKLFNYLYAFNETVLEIKKEAFVQSAVCHYTSLSIADKLIINDENTLRYYNVIYMNDPEEGNILFNILKKGLLEAYNKAKEEEEYNIYLGSFLPADHCDNLIMWRTYGKENNQEAKGCSITIKPSFFDTKLNTFPNKLYNLNSASAEFSKPSFSQPLYKIFYIDKENKVVGENSEKVNSKLNKLNSSFIKMSNFVNSNKKIKGALEIIINQVINSSLSEILYLFKSADYSYEKELRVIVVAPMESSLVKIDSTQFPKKLFIESNKKIRENIEKITLGPKVERPSHWVYLKAKLIKEGLIIDWKESKCKFN